MSGSTKGPIILTVRDRYQGIQNSQALYALPDHTGHVLGLTQIQRETIVLIVSLYIFCTKCISEFWWTGKCQKFNATILLGLEDRVARAAERDGNRQHRPMIVTAGGRTVTGVSCTIAEIPV